MPPRSGSMSLKLLLALTMAGLAAGLVASQPSYAAGTKKARPILADASQELPVYPSPYANYLVGRFAMAQGDVETAAQALRAVSMADTDDSDLREKAFLINILSGDIQRAAALSEDMTPTTETSRAMTYLVDALTAVKAGKRSKAVKAIEALYKLNPHDRNGVLLRPFILAMGGKWKAALSDSGDAELAANDNDRLPVYLIKAERARLYEMRGKAKQAEALYKSLYQPGAASFIFGPDYAGFLERQGRKEEARPIWQMLADQSRDEKAMDALKAMDSATYKPPELPGLTQSMAQALFVSATVSFSERNTELALATLNLSLYLDPESDRARVFLGQLQNELKNKDGADTAWASIAPDSPYYSEAVLRRVWAARADEQTEKALTLVDQGLARDPDNLSLIIEKSSLLHEQEKDTQALAVINDRIARRGDADFGWQAWFSQAIIYDSLNQWPEAEAAIKKAQALNPKQPEILNFLGYGWINRGLHISEGMDLVREAIKANPKSGAIIDSLGWGYYKQGNYEQALSFIEQAVLMDPADAEINEHLGDVYKALGRDTEAGYEWARVLTLKLSDRQAASVRRKLEANAEGLEKATVKTPKSAQSTALNDGRKSSKSHP
ncbi:MAG: tetratricopeptide repeat protein [Asticcacaulis sp.]